jgi:two-component system sensor histidine kinase KdpD
VTVLLDVARLHGSDLAAEFRTFDVGAHVHALADRLGPLFATRPLHLDVSDATEAYGDPRLIDRVVENLLTNALRHTPEGTQVTVSVTSHGDSVVVRVADDGPGLPPGIEERLGERLTNPASPGLGLGLALCREILRLHGTALGLDSTPGSGATFTFSLPCRAATGPTAAATSKDR